jgi:hypothetical protein
MPVTSRETTVISLFSQLEARVFRPAMATFTGNDAVLPFPLRGALDRVDAQLDMLIYDAFPLPESQLKRDTFRKKPPTIDG